MTTILATMPRKTLLSDSYVGGISPYPGGTITVNDVTPMPGRTTGESVKALMDSTGIDPFACN
ncbi:MAG TPA: hypothetical protein VF244_10070 [Acidimicrobiales bacterium]